MRVRNKTRIHPYGLATDEYFDGRQSGTSVVTMPLAFECTTRDVVVSGYKKRSSQGEIFNNPFSTHQILRSFQGRYRNEMWGDDGKIVHRRSWDHGICNFVLSGLPDLIVPVIEPSRIACDNKCLAGVNKTMFNAPVFVAEWHKTVGLFKEAGQRIYDAMLGRRDWKIMRARNGRYYLRTDMRRTKYGAAKQMANDWLAVRFGVTPLLHDLSGACKLLAKPYSLRETSRAKEGFEDRTSAKYSLADSPGTWHFEAIKNTSVELRTGILYHSVDDAIKTLAKVGMTRPYTVAWELAPFSFVVDRFINIGEWLDAIQPDGASEYLAAWRGAKIESLTTVKSIGFTPTDTKHFKNSYLEAEVNIRDIVKVRDPWVPEAVFPSWKTEFRYKHLGDYAGLLMQRLHLKYQTHI